MKIRYTVHFEYPLLNKEFESEPFSYADIDREAYDILKRGYREEDEDGVVSIWNPKDIIRVTYEVIEE